MKTHSLLGAMLLSSLAYAQTPWVLPGNPTVDAATDYVGTQTNVDLVLRTNAIQRFRLNRTTSYTIGNAIFGLQNADGYLGLSPNASLWTAPSPGPFSRLQLHDGAGAPLQLSYRPWMDNGITFTTNNDHMYVGHKVEDGVDQTTAAIQKQRLRRPRSMTGS